jgi:hypothetical protein
MVKQSTLKQTDSKPNALTRGRIQSTKPMTSQVGYGRDNSASSEKRKFEISDLHSKLRAIR